MNVELRVPAGVGIEILRRTCAGAGDAAGSSVVRSLICGSVATSVFAMPKFPLGIVNLAVHFVV